MHHRIPILAALFLLFLSSCKSTSSSNPAITEKELLANVFALASPEMAGREPGRPGHLLAAQYTAGVLEAAGVSPAALDSVGNPSWYQQVPLLRIARETHADITLRTMQGTVNLCSTNGSLLVLHPGALRSDTLKLDGQVYDAVHAIVDPYTGYNDLEGLDLQGKIVLLEIRTPSASSTGINLSDSMNSLYRNPTTALRIRLQNLYKAGVAAIVLIPDTQLERRWQYLLWLRQNLPIFQDYYDTNRIEGVDPPPVFAAHRDALQPLLDYRAAPDPETKIRPAGPIPGSDLSLTLIRKGERFTSPNVIGIVRGSDPVLADSFIVMTAHLDHLGETANSYNPGANDNASGVSVLLEVASKLAADPPAYSTLFLFPTAEEESFLGTIYFSLHSPIPLDAIVAEFNADEVGRIPENPHGLAVIHSEGLKESLWEAGEKFQKENISFMPPGSMNGFFYRSDQIIFHRLGIPAAFITTGHFQEYHSPADVPELIDARMMYLTATLLDEIITIRGN